jgi:hypothetical protein
VEFHFGTIDMHAVLTSRYGWDVGLECGDPGNLTIRLQECSDEESALRDVPDFLPEQNPDENSRQDRGECGLQYGFHHRILGHRPASRCKASP